MEEKRAVLIKQRLATFLKYIEDDKADREAKETAFQQQLESLEAKISK